MQTHVSEAKVPGRLQLQDVRHVDCRDDGCVRALSGPGSRRPMPSGSSDTDMRPACRRGAQVSHNRRRQSAAGIGHRRARDYMRHGVTVGIGTDGSALLRQSEHVRGDAGYAAFVSRVRGLPPAGMDVDRMRPSPWRPKAARGCWACRISSARSRRATRPTSCCLTSTMSTSCRSTTPPIRSCSPRRRARVDKVLIGGHARVRRPRHRHRPAALSAKVNAAVERLAALNAEARRFAERIEPMVSNFCHGLSDSAALSGLHRLLPRH